MLPTDWPAVRDVYAEGIAAGTATLETEVPSWPEWDAAHHAELRFVARTAAGVAGFAAASPVSPRAAYRGVVEVSVYVAAGARDAGIGTTLLRFLDDAAERLGCWTRQAAVLAPNVASQRLLVRAGYRLVGRRERLGQRSGAWHDVLLWERRSAAGTSRPVGPAVKVHLVDGTLELFRCFHGAPRVEIDGREAGAVRGLLATLVALLRGADVTHVAVAFDEVVDVPRAGRNQPLLGPGVDPALRGQYALAAEAVRALGLVSWPMAVRYQADDALASGAERYRALPDVSQVVICTPDKDLAQCVEGDRVVLLDRIRKKLYDEAGVREKFGVAPASIPDYLALVGDPADGIPGLPGWGAKAAGAVLRRYGHLDAIPAAAVDWTVEVRGAERLARTLAERRNEARLYRELTTLRRDVPIQESLDDLRWQGPSDDIEPLCARLDAADTLARIPSPPAT